MKIRGSISRAQRHVKFWTRAQVVARAKKNSEHGLLAMLAEHFFTIKGSAKLWRLGRRWRARGLLGLGLVGLELVSQL